MPELLQTHRNRHRGSGVPLRKPDGRPVKNHNCTVCIDFAKTRRYWQTPQLA